MEKNGQGQNVQVPVVRPDQAKSKPKIAHQPIPSSRYNELLRVIEELGKDVKPSYAGSKNAGERLRKGILHARALVRDCLLETERNARK
ncbi:cyclin-dependent kinase 2-associated protein 1-like [Dendronephthya gigantea]|uniref:cyclin-dependent kinase 2-associated protein 1-like n=1 Tax=Dendronephthya gigantea TaxID=151771 RepID=UPI00106A3FBE|nr:cyclin-dependent kinase 2-associated protein 1-like [Dendronephthya gigantea]XP_028415227.1 cyclin-dependent kinase 2-associated protein 1-like [Dendronephthya gigantea]